ncbi:MAG: hypothetical protein CSB15_00840 [Clostridiales bacterium]|nr:MAG: hypothetical protein CSB15_00840 [Clostridiales bacterium]
MRRNKNNFVNKNYKKKNKVMKFASYLFLTVFIIAVVGAGILFKVVRDVVDDTPPITEYDMNKLLDQNSIIYDSNGKEISKVEDNGLRTIVPYNKIDKDIIKSFVAVEDKTFWEHRGFNYIRLMGSVLESLKTRRSPQGTSTITQQYARNMYLTDSRFAKGKSGYIRKIKEAKYAVDLENKLSKEEILTSYLNTIEFGANCKGIQAACMRYFSKNADDIDYIEAAILAGIPKANVLYSPFKIVNSSNIKPGDKIIGQDGPEMSIVFNENCVKRYKVVLKVMLDNKVINQAQYDKAINFDIMKKLKPSPIVINRFHSYPIDLIKKDVIKKLMEVKNLNREEATSMLYRGGLRIYSTIDSVIQDKLDRKIDGAVKKEYYDSVLKSAVSAFQKKYKLTVDGIAGDQVLNKLAEMKLINLAEFKNKALKPGMENFDVKRLRAALESLGFVYYENSFLPYTLAYRNAKQDIISIDRGVAKVVLNNYNTCLTDSGDLIITSDDYYKDGGGNLVFKVNKMFNFYKVKNVKDKLELKLFLKDVYKFNDSQVRVISGGGWLYKDRVRLRQFHTFKGGVVGIPGEYAKFNSKGEYVLSKSFLREKPDFFKIKSNGTLICKRENFQLSTKGVVQPQVAMTIIDYKTGQLKAIAGGRNVTGQALYNRALNPRQPGSSIKPLGAYIPALDSGYAPASIWKDTPRRVNGKVWPKNWYSGYKGPMTLRKAVEWSCNVVAVKVVDKIGIDKCFNYLEKFGIDSLVKDGPVSDRNPSAIALGGMTKGISPYALSGAYGAIANEGIRNETISFTKVLDTKGKVVLENQPKKTFVVKPAVAWLMKSVLKSTVEGGFSNNEAAIRPGNYGIPVAGKTGTTSNVYDIWFAGFTPYYVGAIWMGNDVNLEVEATSSATAVYWREIMKDVHSGYKNKGFESPAKYGLIRMSVDSYSGLLPSSLSKKDPKGKSVVTDWFIPGTQPTKVDNSRVSISICSKSGKGSTDYCPSDLVDDKIFRIGSGSSKTYVESKNSFGKCNVHTKEAKEREEKIKREKEEKERQERERLERERQEKEKPNKPQTNENTNNKPATTTTYKILDHDIIVKTTLGKDIKVPAGSYVYSNGDIKTKSGKKIFAWQISGSRPAN